jgi:integrase
MTPKARQSNPKKLPPCVYEKHGSFWYVKRGKWINLGKNERAARMVHARMVTQPSDSAMGKLIDDAMVEILSRVKASSGKQYRTAAKQLKEALVEFEPQQVTMADVAQVKRDYLGKPRAGNQALSVLRMVFLYAVENGICTSNPCIGIPLFPVGKRDRLILWGEYHAIRSVSSPMLQCFMDLCVTTGQRPDDVRRIRRSDIEKNVGIYFKQGKTGAKVKVLGNPGMWDAIERAEALHGRIASITLFRVAYSTIYEQWVKACATAGVEDAQLRDLRALAATEAERQKLNPQALMGHTTAGMTRRYLRGRETPEVESPFIRQSIDTAKKQ